MRHGRKVGEDDGEDARYFAVLERQRGVGFGIDTIDHLYGKVIALELFIEIL